MPDMLTHVLTAYVIATLLATRYEWIDRRYVTVAMIGAAIPDLSRMRLLVHETTIERLLGVPFTWDAFHTAGGSAIAVVVGALVVPPRYRRPVLAMLALGAASHHALDVLLINASGYSYAVLWPLTGYSPPTPNLYLSTDRWPALVAIVVALATTYVRTRIGPEPTE